ncbi:hypothetical protein [Undibacterium sp. TJN19]|uniref:hypothetical protein n=1 Tax=Undibacterium sp. TJN19 TaxID=3413055 RepID=UPI003BF2CDFB
MHDWTLISILFDWSEDCVSLKFNNTTADTVHLIANKVVTLFVPKRNEWGRSASVNEVIGPNRQSDGTEILKIEMQSGDVIEIAAAHFVLPKF